MDKSVTEFIDAIEHQTRRHDSRTLAELISKVTGYRAYLSGNIIGFGQYHYCYDSGTEGDAMVVGFSPRKPHLVVYIMPGVSQYSSLLAEIGQVKLGKSCVYINTLAAIDLALLAQLIQLSVTQMQAKYHCIDIGDMAN
ncbi:DUF1801 domain-containing protein [Shewanella sp. NIFS-20-20]|uniref:DUF1801 domain-containing protein n=1 Tax=Shewanella sp. NIFS-20-20 TaxID=2853806 RepID=UPI001C4391D8|nr:DUF1801 domain-containing protein [Shewanella sp. NIFS-20-20]MBV7317286.1 DUF1801 domain-containing protein [Shewanella sp. NIFS-20-20]